LAVDALHPPCQQQHSNYISRVNYLLLLFRHSVTLKNMNDNTIDSLRDALTHSPDNTPLRFLLADTLLSLNRLDEAETEYSTLIKIANDTKAKVGLATVTQNNTMLSKEKLVIIK
jgi:thioredoxin-like negative regulator of GroEL